ncbi:protein FAM47E isoform X2 [Ascaphus truei]
MSVLAGCDSDSQPRHPWYKEKLQKKYLKESNHKLNFSGALNSRRWTFLQRGVDDFRDGYPFSSDTAYIKSHKGPAPVLQNAADETDPAEKKPRKRFTREQACFSKLLPLQQARREYIAEIEYGLTQHPLILYPHLEEGIPPELFEEIVGILDPEMRLRSALATSEAEDVEQEDELSTPQREQQEPRSVKSRDLSTRQSAISEESKPKNPYTWLFNKEAVKEDKKAKIKHTLTPALDDSVKQVTKEFCEWVASLGGEECSVQESTIFSLFASGYDTKPALSVPIHVVELNNVPAELRMSVGFSRPQTALRSSHTTDHRQQSKESTYCPSWVKSRYGAWYLDPKTWKKLKINEPLTDPKAEETDKSMDLRIRLSQKDEELLELHGTIAFNDFIEKKGYRKPEFLVKIFSKKDVRGLENIITRDAESSLKNTMRCSASASTHDSIIN